MEASAKRPEHAKGGHAPEALRFHLWAPLAAAEFPTPSLEERKWLVLWCGEGL